MRSGLTIAAAAGALLLTRCVLPELTRAAPSDDGLGGLAGESSTGGRTDSGGSASGGGTGSGGTGPGGLGGDASGGSGGGPGDTTGPQVVSATPQGILLDGRTPIEVEFDEPVVTTQDSVTVVLDTVVPISGTIEADDTLLRFIPDQPFSLPGNYVVELSDAIADLSGNPLAGEQTFEFELMPGDGGRDNQRLDNLDLGDVSCPHLATDDQGNGMVLFEQGGVLFTRFYEAGYGWHAVVELATAEDGVLSMSRSGQLAVAYTAVIGGVDRIVVRTAEAGNPEWSPAVLADEGSAAEVMTASDCSLGEQQMGVAINDAGAVVVTWKAIVAPGGAEPSAYWMSNVKLADEEFAYLDSAYVYYSDDLVKAPGIAIDAEGNVVLVYEDNEVPTIYLETRFDVSTGIWSSTDSLGYWGADSLPLVSIDDAGDFVWALSTYDNENQIQAWSAAFGSAQENALQDAVSAAQPFLAPRGGVTIAWQSPSGIGLAGRHPTNWTVTSDLVGGATTAHPVVANLEPGANESHRTLIAWEQGTEIAWAIVKDQFGFSTENGPHTLPTGGVASDIRIAYEPIARHGLAVWLEDHSGVVTLVASDFFMEPGQ